ncbi:MAG: porphobilinogen synthase [Gemmatimonadetes bacterium]|nr:porphobilinogen synthase [Gemmatimonadota bacterium]
MDLIQRPRRLRRTASIRTLVRETRLHPADFVQPIFVIGGEGVCEPIDSMPGQYRLSVDELVKESVALYELGIPAINLFGYSEEKDPGGSASYREDGLIQQAIRALKAGIPEMSVQTDVALDPYTDHGHDGVLVDGEIANDASVEVLTRMALSHAEAGVDWVAPSDMMDGRIGAIRVALDDDGFEDVGILAYSAKYASCFYGPFRGALKSAPRKRDDVPEDKKTYQMDYANVDEAIKEIALDIEEGADVVMVKPALAYLDVIARASETFDVPVAAYNVSGEYGMILAAAEKGWVDREDAMFEVLTAIKRAGASMILTYFSKEAAIALRV